MGLSILILGLALLLGGHLFVTLRKSRAGVVSAIGEGPYKAAFSLVAIVGLALIVWGYADYRATGWVNVWSPPGWTRHLVVLLMWPASIFLVAAYVPGDIKRKLKHPMLVSVKLWAAAHLVANGDLGSIVLFGAFLAWAVVDRISLKRRNDPGGPAIPIGGRKNDYIAIGVGTLLYFFLGLIFHPLVVGAPAFGTPAHGI